MSSNDEERIVNPAELQRLMRVPHKHLFEVRACPCVADRDIDMVEPYGYLDTEHAEVMLTVDHPAIVDSLIHSLCRSDVLCAASAVVLQEHVAVCDECRACKPERTFIVTSGSRRARFTYTQTWPKESNHIVSGQEYARERIQVMRQALDARGEWQEVN